MLDVVEDFIVSKHLISMREYTTIIGDVSEFFSFCSLFLIQYADTIRSRPNLSTWVIAVFSVDHKHRWTM